MKLNEIKESNFLPQFLFGSRFRIWRHLIFMLVGAIITFNQAFIAYRDAYAVVGDRIYLIGAAFFTAYLLAMYFNYFYLTPKLLLQGRYVSYACMLCIIVLSLPTLAIAAEYHIRQALQLPHRIASYTNPLILVDNLSSSVVSAICFCGVSVVMLFRKWMSGTRQVARLEQEHIQTELNKLKGQIAPAFLSRTLRTAAESTLTAPQTASDMLMQLGQLLRYQLYDAARDRILLKSEINFLAQFIQLEQHSNPTIQYRIRSEGDINNTFVAPMLFISLIQCIINDCRRLDLLFLVEGDLLVFSCRTETDRPLNSAMFAALKQRLEWQYPDRYTWQVSQTIITLNLEISKS